MEGNSLVMCDRGKPRSSDKLAFLLVEIRKQTRMYKAWSFPVDFSYQKNGPHLVICNDSMKNHYFIFCLLEISNENAQLHLISNLRYIVGGKSVQSRCTAVFSVKYSYHTKW